MRFPYLKQPSSLARGTRWVSRPYIPVCLSYYDEQSTLYALDSGADVTLFHSSVAKTLGIDYQTGQRQPAYGISGQPVDVYYHRIKLQIVGLGEPIELEAGFTDSPGVSALLGQSGFFEHFRITFERGKEWLEIVPVPKANGHSH